MSLPYQWLKSSLMEYRHLLVFFFFLTIPLPSYSHSGNSSIMSHLKDCNRVNCSDFSSCPVPPSYRVTRADPPPTFPCQSDPCSKPFHVSLVPAGQSLAGAWTYKMCHNCVPVFPCSPTHILSTNQTGQLTLL